MQSIQLEQLIEAILGQASLNTVQQIVLQGFLENRTYEEMARFSTYETSYLKAVGAKLCRALSSALGERVTKCNFAVLVTRLQAPVSAVFENSFRPPLPRSTAHHPANLLGREKEFAQLLDDLQREDAPHQFWLCGPSGIGKSTLAQALQETLSCRFDRILCRNLMDNPPAEQLLDSLLQELEPDQGTYPQQTTHTLLEQLLHSLNQRRTLLILDNAEALLDRETDVGDWRPGREPYGELLRDLIRHSSSTRALILSRELPIARAALADNGRVKVLSLWGLPLDAFLQLGQQLGLSGNLELTRLHQYLGGSPLALKLASERILNRFGGSITTFLQSQHGLSGGISDLLDQDLAHLSNLELTLWIWLAIAQRPLSVADLLQLLVPNVSHLRLVRTLEVLHRRQLVEVLLTADSSQQTRYHLLPSLREYVSQLFLNQIVCELDGEFFDYLDRFCLVHTDTSAEVLTSQYRHIVTPLIQALQQKYLNGSEISYGEQTLLDWAQTVLTRLHHSELYRNGYATGNFLTLLRALDLPLRNWNFAGLPIRQADLRHPGLSGADFRGASLTQCAWLQDLGTPTHLTTDNHRKNLYCSDGRGYVRIWSLDLQTLACIPAHTGQVSALALDVASKRMATAGADGEIAFWEPLNSSCLRRFQGHHHQVWGLAFHPREPLISSIGLDGQLISWDWNTGSRRLVISLPAPGYQLCYSRDGQHLLSATIDGLLSCWDSHTGALAWRREVSPRKITTLALDSQGKFLACGDDGGGMAVLNLSTGKLVKQWQGHHKRITSLAFSPADGSLLSSSLDNSCKLWDLSQSKPHYSFRENVAIRCCTFSPDGQSFYYGTDHPQILRRQAASGQLRHEVKGYSIRGWAAGYLQDRVIIGLENGELQVLNAITGQPQGQWTGHQSKPLCLAVTPSQLRLASGSHDGQLRIWDTDRGLCKRVLKGHQADVLALTYSPDDHWLASGDAAGEIRIWDVSTGTCQHHWQGHPDHRVYSLRFSADGRWLSSGSSDCTWRLWRNGTWQLQHSLDVGQEVWALDWHPDSRLLATSGSDNSIWIWDAPAGEPLQKLAGHQRAVKAIRWLPDGEYLISASFDHSLRHWHPASGFCIQTLKGHEGLIWDMALAESQPWVVTTSHDQSIRCWDLEQGQLRWKFDTPRPYTGLQLANCHGLNPAQLTSLQTLGASIHPDML